MTALVPDANFQMQINFWRINLPEDPAFGSFSNADMFVF